MCLILGFGIQNGIGFLHDGVKGKDSTFEICKKNSKLKFFSHSWEKLCKLPHWAHFEYGSEKFKVNNLNLIKDS